MKICVMTYSLFSHGGVQRVISTLFNELSKYHEIDILYLGNLEYCKEKLYGLDEKNIKIIKKKLEYSPSDVFIRKSANALNKYTKVFFNKNSVDKYKDLIYPKKVTQPIVDIINTNGYDVVIGVAGEINLLLGSIADRINSKTIGWQHNSFDAYYNTKNKYLWKKKMLSKEMLKRLDKVVVLTDNDKNRYLQEMGIDAIRIYNPLSFKSDEKSKCDTKNIISVGRLTKQKGFDLLIEAFSIFSKKNSEWNLTIVGEGEEKQNLIELIKKYNLSDRVFIQDFTENIVEYYLKASLYISSARWEGFGLVITEAMECGLPIIAFDNTGPNEIITNNNGIIVENGNIYKLVEKIVDISNDDHKIRFLSKQSIQRARDFNVNSIVNYWNLMLDNIIKKV